MTEERKVEVTIEEPAEAPKVEVDVNVEAPEKDDEEDEKS